ncbi:hypothetical protein EUX98_g5058 [Antrodiella citrinella]|uniref:Uncharacterized protein n=1 Tax=Antrodiella citrinella TaxID=2447956 RepID=A0A4S4MSH2_9APHY|nr:hypothetical protein EUX98_g5058 [Antrodiella citrinella]
MASADVRFTDWLTLSFMTVFTPLAIQGLQRGDMQIVIGGDSRIWEKFEKDKVAAVAETKERTRALRTAIQISKDV